MHKPHLRRILLICGRIQIEPARRPTLHDCSRTLHVTICVYTDYCPLQDYIRRLSIQFSLVPLRWWRSANSIERHRTVASATPLQKLIFGLAASCSDGKQTTCPSAHCGFVLRSQSFLARSNAPPGCNSGDTVPSRQFQNKTWRPKLNWRRKPRCCRRTIK